MEKAQYDTVVQYLWYCPMCGSFNFQSEDPHEGILKCRSCKSEFEPEKA